MAENPAPPPLTGFGNHHSSEAVAGALPIGQNSPQQAPFGLYAEQFSATAFTAPRHENLRSWLYRLRPSAQHPPFTAMATPPSWQGAEFSEATPNRLRWNPLQFAAESDFLDSLTLYARTGHPIGSEGSSIYLYAATRSMERRAFFSADGEFLIVPQHGTLHIRTELGLLTVPPLQIALIPRGMRFQVMLPDGPARGFVCENHGAAFRLPELGPIGANGLANPRDFEAPNAAFEDADTPHQIVQKYQGKLWSHHLPHSPFDVVAWHGNAAPYRYDLTRFNTINTVSFDHPDPSIFTLLTSPSDTAGMANLDFVLFPPRWMVAEHSFRPPWFHRNIMSEFMGLITGSYDAKAEGFAAGGASLHNSFSAHGPDAATYQAAINTPLTPQKIENSMAFMFESRLPFAPTSWALNSSLLQPDYDDCWANFPKATLPERPA